VGHVYHEVTLVRHNTSLNYTGLRKIVKKFLKKTCKAIAEVGLSLHSGYQIGHMDHTDCHQLNRVLTA
jgi:hypothetical protein